ncbi:MAG: T9SS type A sorting domain-containing protein [Saprospiraceae bacterium]|nr:T9SS type A sorting domain-containing protein [Saprospiraceae bacterium]
MKLKQHALLLTKALLCLIFLYQNAPSVLGQNKSIILGRPTDTSMTANILFDQNVQFYLEYGTQSGVYNKVTTTISNRANVPDEFDLRGLAGNTKYFYRLRWKLNAATTFSTSPEYTFRTQRAQGSTFRFILNADEHLYDKKGVRSLYQVTLANQAKDSADFMLSLGDTFGDDHDSLTMTSASSDALHKDYLQYLGQICHSLPFYFCLGNHEGELGSWLNRNAPNNMAVWGTLWRKYYYPNPFPNGFYSGNTVTEGYGMGQPENYYAWTWGDALFVVLDVYRHCDINDKPQNWDWTLGKTQYDWLKRTLETSRAKHKFVFAHHTRGQGRGGKVTASGFEWGGYANGRYLFDTYRPGWGMPIHQLMVANGVKIFFQGHDHLYAKEDVDGMVYQEVPMAADSTYEIGVLANADAYTDITRAGSGHVRVTVSPNCVTVDFVRAYLPKDTIGGTRRNGEIAHSYTIGNCATSIHDTQTEPAWTVFPNPVSDRLFVNLPTVLLNTTTVQLINLQGQVIQYQRLTQGETACQFDVNGLPTGIYAIKWSDERGVFSRKVVIE